VIVRYHSPMHAIGFAAASGLGGITMLYFGVNGLCASLGALTLFLYTLVYTPMKRTSVYNTWIGSVGKLPTLFLASYHILCTPVV